MICEGRAGRGGWVGSIPEEVCGQAQREQGAELLVWREPEEGQVHGVSCPRTLASHRVSVSLRKLWHRT